MSIRSNLATNLRRLCTTRGSVNAVCRELGLNRQQFDKYLSSDSIPNSRTLKRLTAYFNIEEHELFADPLAATAGTPKRPEENAPSACDRVLKPLVEGPIASLREGYYYTWISLPGRTDRLICAPMFIQKRENALTFRRVVGVAEPKEDYWSHYVGNHKGVVVERLNWFFFAGINQRGTLEPTLMRMRWVALSEPVLSGHAMVLSPSGVSFVAVCMRPMPAHFKHKTALQHSRTFSVNAPEIDAVTRYVIDQQRKELTAAVIKDLSYDAAGLASS